MDELELAYLAGAMDSDGYFSIKKSTYGIRKFGDRWNPTYMEIMGLKQVSPVVPRLLQHHFGGYLFLQGPRRPNSKPLWGWQATDRQAAGAVALLSPYLHLKWRQAVAILELRESKRPHYGQLSYWFAKAHPDWPEMELIDTKEAADILGYGDIRGVQQAIAKGMILALPGATAGRFIKRIPLALVQELLTLRGPRGGFRLQPRPLVEWRETLFQQVRELNKIGIHGTPVYHRTGPYRML